MLIKNLSIICLFGSIGVLARWMIGEFFPQKIFWGSSSLALWIVNILGCFLLTYLWSAYPDKFTPNGPWVLAVQIALLGGLTTYSSYIFEAFQFLTEGRLVRFFTYVCFFHFLALLASYVGFVTGKSVKIF